MTVRSDLASAIASLPFDTIRQEFVSQDEFFAMKNFIPQTIVEHICDEFAKLRPKINRNYIPKHKKGGSVSRFTLEEHSPTIKEIYETPEFFDFLNNLVGGDLQDCPPEDPHAYALYCYTEPGDHIGFHYDTSYYKGRRYTILIGVIDDSTCELEYDLFTKNPQKETTRHSTSLAPGDFVFFNGDNLYHRITPLGEGEERIALTLEYVTDQSMGWFPRFVSNMKDSIAYFGFKNVFLNKKGTTK